MLFQCCQCLGRVVGMPGSGEAEEFSVFCTEAADELLEVGVVAYIRIVSYPFPVIVAMPESETPGVTLAFLQGIIAGGVPGVGMKNAEGSAIAYQGHRFR